MRILICSHRFAPSVGGIESVGRLLAESFLSLGQQVRVVTRTEQPSEPGLQVPVLRRPWSWTLFGAVRWSDLCLHNNISLQCAWPLLCLRRPWVVIHHTWIRRPDGRLAWRDRCKRRVLACAHSVSISQAVAESLPGPSTRIPDPYDDALFRLRPDIARTGALMFVGRLVSDKGLDLLLQAMGWLRQQGLTPDLTVVGDGPERAALEQLSSDLDLGRQVSFVGWKTGCALAELLNQHRILVVPSRWQEPFGLVALEGIASGCVVVGSQDGGLKHAIGPCGVTFPNGDSTALGRRLRELLVGPGQLRRFQAQAESHLRPHRKLEVARRYLDLFASLGANGARS